MLTNANASFQEWFKELEHLAEKYGETRDCKLTPEHWRWHYHRGENPAETLANEFGD